MERVTRLELATHSLGSYCSTTELYPRMKLSTKQVQLFCTVLLYTKMVWLASLLLWRSYYFKYGGAENFYKIFSRTLYTKYKTVV